MSDFPRGWTLVNESAAGTPSITVPAIAGVVHVLDAFTAIAGSAGAAGTFVVLLSSSDGTFTNVPIGLFSLQAAGEASDSDSGLDLAAGPGASLTVVFSAAVGAGNTGLLRIKGHDI